MKGIEMKFIGGVLDGQEHDVDTSIVRVPVQNGVHHKYPDQVVLEWQVYERVGGEMAYKETKNLW